MKALLFCCLLICVGFGATAQWQSYQIGVRGDTINKVDKSGKKQGMWVIQHDELRGEPGFEEEGVYVDDRKEGVWKKFSLQGDKFANENYHLGYKDGPSQYYNLNGDLVREESWRGFNPDKQYDTIDVEDVTHPNKYDRVVIKNEGSSLKNGQWKYYDTQTGFITKTEFWIYGKLEGADAKAAATPKKAADSTSAAKVKPKEVLDFEKKNSGKKKVKYQDGSTF